MEKIINLEQIEYMKQLEDILIRIMFPILIGWLFFKMVEYLTNKISIRDYEYSGMDLSGGETKVIWYYSKNDRNIDDIKYNNNKYYFKVFTQFFKEGIRGVIDIENKQTYDFSTIVIFNKKEMDFKTRFNLIKWLIIEFVKNKIEPKRNKKLPKFLIEPYVFTDALYLNMENFHKSFDNIKLINEIKTHKQQLNNIEERIKNL